MTKSKVAEETKTKAVSGSEVSFPSFDPSCNLRGDLALPLPNPAEGGGQIPAIVVVAGSGPIDRNGNAPSLGLNFNMYNRLASHFAEKRPEDTAVAFLSYDKRGVGKSQPTPKDKNFYYRAGMWDLVGDAVEAVRFLTGHPRIDEKKIVLLGHSEGGILLPLVCRKVADDVDLAPIAGCIFYSGFGENLIDAMAFQRTTLLREVEEKPGPLGWILRQLMTKERLEKQYEGFLKKVNAPDEPDFVSMQCGLAKQPAKWLREHIACDVNEALREHVTCHVLAVTGRKDFQVRNEFCEEGRARELAPLAASVEAHRPLNLTHILRSMEGEAKMLNLKRDYARMGKAPLDAELLRITDSWCDRVLF